MIRQIVVKHYILFSISYFNKQEVILPTTDNDKKLANSFANYFVEKISKLRDTFTESKLMSNSVDIIDDEITSLTEFEKTTNEEILQIVKSYGVKCSPEDPVPVVLIKTHLELFVPIWTELVNFSLRVGSMECLKSAVVIPLIKELDCVIDRDVLKNYRPVSNLLFLEKIIERVVSMRLNKHMEENNLHSPYQYGYKKGHSTETLLVKIVNDLLISCDRKKPTILLMLDLSAAFDTVDQKKLLSILQNQIKVKGIALKWFNSFLTERTQRIKIKNSYSDVVKLMFGVVQGSVLGPDLFNIYIRSLYSYIQPAQFSIYGFADDHQLMKYFVPVLQVKAFDGIDDCIQMINKWMNDFFLCLNPSKTKILIIKPPSINDKIILNGTHVSNSCIRFVKQAKNLGIIIDESLSMETQINQVVKSCFSIIKKIASIKSFLSSEQLKTIICTCVFSKIDYCNALYYGVNNCQLNKLQAVQNSAIHLTRKRENKSGISSKDYLRKFHWLPVNKRIKFKLLLMIHNCLYGKAPTLLCDMFKYGASSRTNRLEERRSIGVYGDRSISIGGSKLWNLLPISIRMEKVTNVFKKKIKTFLFRELDNPNSNF